MKTLTEHWNEIFKKTDEKKLGWYEDDYSQTMKLLGLIPEWKNSKIFVPGVGTSDLINLLLQSNAKLVLNDLSSVAIEKAKNKYNDRMLHVQWICQDISKTLPLELNYIDIWIDRAVLHFLTDEDDIKGYFENVKSTLKTGGHAIFAEFSKTGASKCAGLTLHRYSIEELSEKLGSSFKLVSHFDYTYINPYGDPRPYIYTLYKREK